MTNKSDVKNFYTAKKGSKIEIYYDKNTDAILMVQDGKLMTCDNNINSTEFLSYFNIEEVKDFNKLTAEEILDGFNCLMKDFQYLCPNEVQEYLEGIKNEIIHGELIVCKYVE